MDTQYFCQKERRHGLVENSTTLNGIHFLEVASPDQKKLAVHFHHPLPGQSGGIPNPPVLTTQNVIITGGTRVHDIRVESVTANGKVLTVQVNARGDFSYYTLRLVISAENQSAPNGFDPQLAWVDFSFKVECRNEFDCKPATSCPPEPRSEPVIDYLAKDYASFRGLMLDRLSLLMPDWHERNPADLQIALVELLAYTGDHLSYFQDAVATEAYLGTARRRVSARRHARLLDYSVHDGTNARTWVFIRVAPVGAADGQLLPAGIPLLARQDGRPPSVANVEFDQEPIVFETMHGLTLRSAHNEFDFYTWSNTDCCLPRGATRATLLANPGNTLGAGDVLIFEEVISPTKGPADPAHRAAVRLKSVTGGIDPLDGTTRIIEIEWDSADALRFPLCLSALITPAGGGPSQMKKISVARGNIVLADHGRIFRGEPLVPDEVPASDKYRPQLKRSDLTFAVPYDHNAAKKIAAAAALAQDPRDALPAGARSGNHGVMTVSDGREEWQPQRDLLSTDRFLARFVIETELNGTAYLRFGDDTLGKAPSPLAHFTATYRTGRGRAGNIGADSLACMVTPLTGIEQVRNPLAASGGTDPESMEQVRQFAPEAFRTQERAVTEADYAEVARRHPEVQQAAARFRWTGSWQMVFVAIDRKNGRPVDEAFEKDMRKFLELYRLAGYDLEIDAPIFVPLNIAIMVCVKPGFFRSDVKQTLSDIFSNRDLAGGGRGFFHPDNFTFGQPIYLSRIYETAMTADGVASVEVTRFERFGKTPNKELENYMLTTAPLEIVRLDNDPSFPENGKIDFEMHEGL
jgi:Baseplate J-like protein